MKIVKVSAFTEQDTGGNPAGVVVTDTALDEHTMQSIAQELGFSETVFAVPFENDYRVRYFSPQSEVAFCGHATLALGFHLHQISGKQALTFKLSIGDIGVTLCDGLISMESPPAYRCEMPASWPQRYLDLLNLSRELIDASIGIQLAHAGNHHLVIPLLSEEAVDDVSYDVSSAQTIMQADRVVTIALVYRQSDTSFYVRNLFAFGGVIEDPATGSAAAALSGLLRDTGQLNYRNHAVMLSILQGVAMGMPCRLLTQVSEQPQSSVIVSGRANYL